MLPQQDASVKFNDGRMSSQTWYQLLSRIGAARRTFAEVESQPNPRRSNPTRFQLAIHKRLFLQCLKQECLAQS